MLIEKWKRQEVADFDGLSCASGETFVFRDQALCPLSKRPEIADWLNVGVLAAHEVFGGKYLIKCGEAAEHGSIGVVVLESLQTKELIWSFVSSWSNPFHKIEDVGSRMVVISTSGAVFRFMPPMEDVKLFL